MLRKRLLALSFAALSPLVAIAACGGCSTSSTCVHSADYPSYPGVECIDGELQCVSAPCSMPTRYFPKAGGCCPVELNSNACNAVNPASFDQTCTQDADCVLDSWACALCLTAVMSKNGKVAYEAAIAATYEGYVLPEPFAASCPPLEPVCDAGLCAIGAL